MNKSIRSWLSLRNKDRIRKKFTEVRNLKYMDTYIAAQSDEPPQWLLDEWEANRERLNGVRL